MDMNPFKPLIQNLDEFCGKFLSIKESMNKFYSKLSLTKATT